MCGPVWCYWPRRLIIHRVCLVDWKSRPGESSFWPLNSAFLWPCYGKMVEAVLFPGNPQANMYFTLYGFSTLEQAHGLIRDLKLVSVFSLFVRMFHISKWPFQGSIHQASPTSDLYGSIFWRHHCKCIHHLWINEHPYVIPGCITELHRNACRYTKSPQFIAWHTWIQLRKSWPYICHGGFTDIFPH